MPTLKITNLTASILGKHIVNGVNLIVESGEIHAIMGPNGSGKSTLAATLMGDLAISLDSGTIQINDQHIETLTTDKRALSGLFLGYQYPMEIPGVAATQLLRIAYNTQAAARALPPLTPAQFQSALKSVASNLGIPHSFLQRSMNEGFSGGEKKKMEMLQCWILAPLFAVLDETDSGLDVDALKCIAQTINRVVQQHATGVLLITHYQRILEYVRPTHVHVFVGGKIVESGGPELARKIEHEGYGKYQ
ncbi:Fe-S cluster assembly ATPase SufC [Candidatus Uhrbacteria bacterium]|nr:Fe-S cluster assembly ATPase SufC [Candidatus Uhrbacteria bacterium]